MDETEAAAARSSAPEGDASLSRIEDASLNASAPREQRWVDGWLLRFCAGKAKRARSIQPVATGRLDVAGKLGVCLPIYAAAGLPPLVRITPFAQPPGLDETLARLGWERFDDVRVMVVRQLAALPATAAAIGDATSSLPRFVSASPAALAEWVGAARGSSPAERAAHAARMEQAPVQIECRLAVDAEGAVLAAGHVAIEGPCAGLYDIVTAPASRRRGIARALCRHLLERARSAGAETVYLQVEADNDAACRLYAGLGFEDGYRYHYRALSQTARGPLA